MFARMDSRWLCLAAGCILLTGCSRDPQAQKQKYLDKGHSYFVAEKYREAVIEYRNAIQIDPNLADAHYQLAECYLKQENWGGAYEELGRTVALQPNNWKAEIELGKLYLSAGRFSDARTTMQKVLTGDPQNAEAQIALSSADAGLRKISRRRCRRPKPPSA